MEFKIIKAAVAAKFELMAKHPLYRTDAQKDAVWATYLESFPPGTNEIYRERREYDCNCCKSFIRAVGNVVAIIDGKLVSVWDVNVAAEPGFQQVADALSQFVKKHRIADAFLHYERTAGVDKNFEQLTEGQQAWNHFFVNIPSRHVAPKDSIPTRLGKLRDDQHVLLRSVREITPDAVDTVLELIAQNTLYRGAEHKFAVTEFRKIQQTMMQSNAADQEVQAWDAVQKQDQSGAVFRIRNTSIGTLLTNLSEGMDLEKAVKAYEVVVAPSNYKRPTALVTKDMINKAKAKLEELGLTSALERRHAVLSDISVNNVLFADRSARKVMSGSVFDDLVPTAQTAPKGLAKVDEVPIAEFVANILPKIDSMEVVFENGHVGNLVSLVAPVDPTAGRLFKWDNRFSWSYKGDLADSIKTRVKNAGGNVTGELCCRLGWFNYDDLDLHMAEPGGYELYFGTRSRASPAGGKLDVDMNVSPTTREPVENIFYNKLSSMLPGEYRLKVHCYSFREKVDTGFELEIDIKGDVHTLKGPAMKQSQVVHAATFKVGSNKTVEFEPHLPAGASGKNVWGLQTGAFHKVNVLLLSPNHWDDRGVGNLHYLFMLDGCANDEGARGFYNEFLKSELDPHRKVFELVGSKLKVLKASEQLSGLGFSSTQPASLLCRVKGTFTRTIKIVF